MLVPRRFRKWSVFIERLANTFVKENKLPGEKPSIRAEILTLDVNFNRPSVGLESNLWDEEWTINDQSWSEEY